MNTSSLLSTLGATLAQANTAASATGAARPQAPVRQGPAVDDSFSRALDRKRDDERLAASREASRQAKSEPAPQISEEARALERRELESKTQSDTQAKPGTRPYGPPVEPQPGAAADAKTNSAIGIAKLRALHAGSGAPGAIGNTGPLAPPLPPRLPPILEPEMGEPVPVDPAPGDEADEADVSGGTIICLAPTDAPSDHPAVAALPVVPGTARDQRPPAGDAPVTTHPVSPADEGTPVREGTDRQPIRVDHGPAGPGAPTSAQAGATPADKLAADAADAAAATQKLAQASAAAAPLPQESAPMSIPAAPQAAVAPATQPAAASAPVAEGKLHTSPGSPAFNAELGTQVTLWVRDGVHQAKLQLNPAEMGPVVVQIQIDGNQAQVRLAAEQADTRQALEQALPFLAGSLSEAGLTLAGGGVFDQPAQRDGGAVRDGGDRSTRDRRAAADTEAAEAAAAAARSQTGPVRSRGVVDLIA